MTWPQPNAHGVYQPTETLAMETKGAAQAEIRLCQIEDGWMWAVSYQTNRGGGSGTLSRSGGGDLDDTRAAALANAVAGLRQRLASHARVSFCDISNEACVKTIEAWLDGIEQQQAEPSLFDWAAA